VDEGNTSKFVSQNVILYLFKRTGGTGHNLSDPCIMINPKYPVA